MNSAFKVIKILKENSFEGYLVGGVVRDYLLKTIPNDIDITTNARPFQLMKLFANSKPTGLKYGTVTVFMDNDKIEVTTYRTDGKYLDNRHPENVIYGDDVLEDVYRRDFTINGLLMDENQKVIDHVGGIKDLNNKIIRTIRNPQNRFSEDALRILRAVYFKSKLAFTIEEKTLDAMREQRHLLKNISKERVLQELIKILKGKDLNGALKVLIDTKIAELLPGLQKGIEHFLKNGENPFVDLFFATSFALNSGVVPEYYCFSNRHRNLYKGASYLANLSSDIKDKDLYTYGLEICLLANKVNYTLKRSKYQKNDLIRRFDNLIIRSELDLKLRAQEMIELAKKKAGAWVKETQDEIIDLIFAKKINNNKDEIIDYLKKKGIINEGIF